MAKKTSHKDFITLLRSPSKMAVKTHTYKNGVFVSTHAYDNIKTWDFKTVEVGCLTDVLWLLNKYEVDPHTVVIRGQHPDETGFNVRRLKTVFAEADHNWLMVDLDDVKATSEIDPTNQADLINAALEAIEAYLPECFHGRSVIVQWSQSAGVKPWTHLRLHLWFWLDRPMSNADVKTWYRSDEMLNRNVDLAMTSSNQVHYIGQPAFIGIDDPFPLRSACIIPGEHKTVTPPTADEVEAMEVKTQKKTKKTRKNPPINKADLFAPKHRYPKHTTPYGRKAIKEMIKEFKDIDKAQERSREAGLKKSRHGWIFDAGMRLGSLDAGREFNKEDSDRAVSECEKLADVFRDDESRTFREGFKQGQLEPMRVSEFGDSADLIAEQETIREEMRRNLLKMTYIKKLDGYRVKKDDSNLALILEYDPELKSRIRFNEFTNQVEPLLPLPWKHHATERCWTDNDAGKLSQWMSRVWGLGFGERSLDVQVNCVADEHRFDPLTQWAKDLPSWDGTDRVDTVFSEFCCVGDSPIIRKIAGFFFLSVIARAMEPGCKMDYVLVLDGEGGTEKSEFLATLTPYSEWYDDTSIEIGNKDALQHLEGLQFWEFSELDAFTSKKDAGKMKNFVTARKDKYRPPYMRRQITVLRRPVIVATVNGDGGSYLRDITGNRRFWIIKVTGKADRKGFARVCEQVYAEAFARWQAAEQRWPTTEEDKELAKLQASATVFEPWLISLQDWLTDHPETDFLTFTDIGDLLDIKVRQLKVGERARLATFLYQVGFSDTVTRAIPKKGASKQSGWKSRSCPTLSDLEKVDPETDNEGSKELNAWAKKHMHYDGSETDWHFFIGNRERLHALRQWMAREGVLVGEKKALALYVDRLI